MSRLATAQLFLIVGQGAGRGCTSAGHVVSGCVPSSPCGLCQRCLVMCRPAAAEEEESGAAVAALLPSRPHMWPYTRGRCLALSSVSPHRLQNLHVYISEHEHFTDFNATSALFWEQHDLVYGDWTSGENSDGCYEHFAELDIPQVGGPTGGPILDMHLLGACGGPL